MSARRVEVEEKSRRLPAGFFFEQDARGVVVVVVVGGVVSSLQIRQRWDRKRVRICLTRLPSDGFVSYIDATYQKHHQHTLVSPTVQKERNGSFPKNRTHQL
jgi:hypothetical protein